MNDIKNNVPPGNTPAVLFVCVHNSGRSQMAEAIFNHLAEGKAQAFSAGTRPAAHTDRTVRQAMDEIGIDISGQRPKLLTPEMIESAGRIISMGCGAAETCPVKLVPAEEWQIDDPEGKAIEEVRAIRDDIMASVLHLMAAASQKNNGERLPLTQK